MTFSPVSIDDLAELYLPPRRPGPDRSRGRFFLLLAAVAILGFVGVRLLLLGAN